MSNGIGLLRYDIYVIPWAVRRSWRRSGGAGEVEMCAGANCPALPPGDLCRLRVEPRRRKEKPAAPLGDRDSRGRRAGDDAGLFVGRHPDRDHLLYLRIRGGAWGMPVWVSDGGTGRAAEAMESALVLRGVVRRGNARLGRAGYGTAGQCPARFGLVRFGNARAL